MNQNIEVNEEIDLRDLFLTLWHGKIYIILFSIVSIFLASLYLQSAVRKYSVEYNLKPVAEVKNKSNIGGLGGLASFAGIDVTNGSNDDFNIFKKLITSVEVSEIIFENKKIIKDLFSSEWNDSVNNYLKPQKSKAQTLKSNVINLLTGNKEVNYEPPNPKRLATFINGSVQIGQEKETGFLKLTSETSQPELILSLIIEATNASDKIMRQRYINFSKEPLVFYKKKLRTARSREHREALAELIASEEQKLMFASLGKYFVAEPYINPVISVHPIAPNPNLILTLSLILGLLFGSTLVLILRPEKKDN
jgi:LPS O-antigen subunit length determinant protein (WzzB/FepE family)